MLVVRKLVPRIRMLVLPIRTLVLPIRELVPRIRTLVLHVRRVGRLSRTTRRGVFIVYSDDSRLSFVLTAASSGTEAVVDRRTARSIERNC